MAFHKDIENKEEQGRWVWMGGWKTSSNLDMRLKDAGETCDGHHAIACRSRAYRLRLC
jgi:hypothetical protein